MKTNEAPEKIYVPTTGDEIHYHTACPNNEFQESIEYTRTDVFIEKAKKFMNTVNEYLYYCISEECDYIDTDKFIEDFENYIKGE